jgi:hypothetical protein
VLTYNLLADQYASQEYSQKVLFAHTPPPLLDIALRKQRILRQLLNSGADVMCLQVRRCLLLPACLLCRRGPHQRSSSSAAGVMLPF